MNTDTNNLITDALESISKEDFRGAKELLEKVIEFDGENPENYKNLGLCEVNLDNNDGAILAFKKAYELNPNDATTAYYYACCVSKNDKQKALELFKEVIDLRKEFLDAYKSLAMIYIEVGQLDMSVEIAKEAINNPDMENDYSIFYICATALMLKKDYSGAIEYLTSALEFKPEHLPVLNSLSTCYMNVQNFSKAKEYLETAYKVEPENPLTLYNLGICNQMEENYSEALEYFKKAYSIEPTVAMLSSLAFCALKSGDYSLASNLYKNLVNTYPNNIEYRCSYSEALEELGEFESALEQVEALLALDEKNVALIKKKGTYLRKLRRNEESNSVFQTLLNRGKIDIEVYYNLAFNFAQLGDFDNSKEMFKKCIILEPNNPYAHKDLGVLYLKMNCYDWAIEEMKEAIKLEEDVSEFHYSLGVSYMMLSETENAKKSFTRALELDNQNADALAYLGYIYMLDRNYDKAKETLKEALKIDSDNFLAKSHMAKLYFQMKNYETAREFLSDITEKTQDDETLNMLGFCNMELGDYEKAMGIFFNLVRKYPQNHIILINLAKCEKNCSRKKEALEHIRQALMIYQDDLEALKLLKELEDD